MAKTEAEIFEFWEPEEMKRFPTPRGWGQRDGGVSHTDGPPPASHTQKKKKLERAEISKCPHQDQMNGFWISSCLFLIHLELLLE